MKDDAEQLIAVAAANPVGAELLARISRSYKAKELHHLAIREISATQGLNPLERRGLQVAIDLRFCAMNAAAAVHQPPKPRWLQVQTSPASSGPGG